MKALIIGGGIGGLTCAIGLLRKGFEVEVFEQAGALTEVGAGIQIGPNGSRIMKELGLETLIANRAVQPDAWEMRDLYDGQIVYRAPLKLSDGTNYWGAPLYNIHRADLIDLLASELPADVVRLGAKVEYVENTSHGALIRLSDGAIKEGDVVIAADGINSIVRHQLWGEDERRFAGFLMWRSLLDYDKVRDLDLPERGNYWTGPGRTLITYWVRPKKTYSILATVPSTEVHRESWDINADVEDIHRSFSGAEPKAASLIERINEAFVTGMYFRDPIKQWSLGNITLLGDAAHPMTPYYAQGATQSFEDTWVLINMLERYAKREGVAHALKEYEQRRIPRATRFQAASRGMVKIVHESDPGKIRARNGLWKGQRRIDPYLTSDFMFAWGYDPIRALDERGGRVKGISGTYEGHRKQREISQKAFEIWKSTIQPEDVARGYEGLRDAYARMLNSFCPLPPGTQVTPIDFVNSVGIRITPAKSRNTMNPKTILHFHGGGYVLGSARSSVEYASRLSSIAGCPGFSVDYRLAPEHPYPAALDDALAAYKWLITQAGFEPRQIIISGESAGGGLALSLALMIRTAKLPRPAGILCVSPMLDMTVSGATLEEFDGLDPAANKDTLRMMAEAYFQGHEPLDHFVSPVFAQLEGLPPIFVSAAKDEVLRSDTDRLVIRAEQAGVHVTPYYASDSVHIFPIFDFLPETQEFERRLASWLDGL